MPSVTFVIRVIAAVLVGLSFIPAVAAQSRPPLPPRAAPTEYVIGNGDLVEVRVFRQPDLSGRYRISEKGTILLPLVGEVVLGGLTELQGANLLRTQLDEYLQDPQVSMTVVEYVSQAVTVIGGVRSPGRFVLHGPTHLLDVIFMAGGLSSVAGQSVQIVRFGKPSRAGQPISETVMVSDVSVTDLLGGRMPEANKLLEAGDLVRVEEADTIYVSGSVNKPGTYTGVSLTLSQALILAGGLTPTAQKNNISISRVTPGKPGREEIVCDYATIAGGKGTDPVLQPNDVVFVRNSERRSLALSTTKALVSGFVTVLPFVLLTR